MNTTISIPVLKLLREYSLSFFISGHWVTQKTPEVLHYVDANCGKVTHEIEKYYIEEING